jgi:hypothetical protein
MAIPVEVLQGRQVMPSLVDICPIQPRISLILQDQYAVVE